MTVVISRESATMADVPTSASRSLWSRFWTFLCELEEATGTTQTELLYRRVERVQIQLKQAHNATDLTKTASIIPARPSRRLRPKFALRTPKSDPMATCSPSGCGVDA